MSKRKVFLVLLTISFLCGCSNANNQPEPNPEEIEPIYQNSKYTNSLFVTNQDESVTPFLGADPDIIKGDDGYFYLYTSQNFVYLKDEGRTLDYCPIYRSDDMVNWEYCSSAFLKQDVNLDEFCYPGFGIWAPSINHFYDRYYLYYSIGYTKGEYTKYMGIGLAISDTPYGPWEHYGQLFTSEECGVPVSIDPFAFQEDDGTIYLIWGSYYGIYAVEMTIDGIEVKDKANIKTNKIQIITDTFDMSKNYEGTYIFKKDGKYYFTGSKNGYIGEGGGLNSKYNVYSGCSNSLLGPYLGSDGNDVFGGGDLVIDGDFDHDDGLRGVGHNSVIMDDKGDYWLVYHCYDPNCPIKDERTICIDKLIFEENGTFHTENFVASHTEKDGPSIRVN